MRWNKSYPPITEAIGSRKKFSLPILIVRHVVKFLFCAYRFESMRSVQRKQFFPFGLFWNRMLLHEENTRARKKSHVANRDCSSTDKVCWQTWHRTKRIVWCGVGGARCNVLCWIIALHSRWTFSLTFSPAIFFCFRFSTRLLLIFRIEYCRCCHCCCCCRCIHKSYSSYSFNEHFEQRSFFDSIFGFVPLLVAFDFLCFFALFRFVRTFHLMIIIRSLAFGWFKWHWAILCWHWHGCKIFPITFAPTILSTLSIEQTAFFGILSIGWLAGWAFSLYTQCTHTHSSTHTQYIWSRYGCVSGRHFFTQLRFYWAETSLSHIRNI